jgi:predicted dehydrogenase
MPFRYGAFGDIQRFMLAECHSAIDCMPNGYLILPQRPAKPPVGMTQTQTINIGLIGAGAIARAHALGYCSARTYFGSTAPPVRLRRVAEANENLARSAAERLGFEEWTDDWQSLVASPDIDAVSIVTPNFLHAPMAIAAAAAGKHVFCEKPLAVSAADAQEMHKAAELAGVVHAVNFNYRKVPAVQFIRRLIEEGRLGEVRQFRAAFLQDWGNDARIPRSWKFQSSRNGAGALGGVGSHIIDLSRFLVGELDRVVATTEIWVKQRPLPTSTHTFELVQGPAEMAPVDVDDSAYFLGRFANGAIGTFEVTRCAPGRKNYLVLEIHGSRGSIFYDYERCNEVQVCLPDGDPARDGFSTVIVGPAQDRSAPWAFPGLGVGFAESVIFQVKDFLTAIVGGAPMSPDFFDGWRTQVVVEAVLESVDRGWVSIPPVLPQTAEQPKMAV